MTQACPSCGSPHSDFDVDCPGCGLPLDDPVHGPGKHLFDPCPRFTTSLQERPSSISLNPADAADYLIEDLIRKDQDGILYALQDLHLARKAALWVGPVATEGGITTLDHPNFTALYHYWVADNREHVVMEWQDNAQLSDHLRNGKLDPALRDRWMHQAALALAAAHGQDQVGWVLDPQRILVDSTGNLKLSPLCRARQSRTAEEDLSELGRLMDRLQSGPPLLRAWSRRQSRRNRSVNAAEAARRLGALPRPLPNRKTGILITLSFSLLLLPLIWAWRVEEKSRLPSPDPGGIAVLALGKAGSDPQYQIMGEGLTQVLEEALRFNPDPNRFWLLPADHYSTDDSADVLAKKFGIRWALSGHLRQQENQDRLTLILLQAANLRQIDQRVIVVPAGDRFALVSQMIENLAAMLGLTSRPTLPWKEQDPHALEQMLEGLGYLRRGTPTHLEASLAAFDRALEKSPQFTAAWLARVQSLLAQSGNGQDLSSLQEAEANLEHVKQLSTPQYWTLLGDLRRRQGRWRDAQDAYQNAGVLWYSQWATAKIHHRLGEHAEAEQIVLDFLAKSPGHVPGLAALLRLYRESGNIGQTEALSKKLDQLAPEYPER